VGKFILDIRTYSHLSRATTEHYVRKNEIPLDHQVSDSMSEGREICRMVRI